MAQHFYFSLFYAWYTQVWVFAELCDSASLRMVDELIDIFKKVTRTRKQLLVAIISAAGVRETAYAEDFLDAIVDLKDLFAGE